MEVIKPKRRRRKIQIKKIKNEEDRNVIFSKRKSSIYKKASELVTSSGAEIGIVMFSPSGTPFSFGYPSIKTVANQFLGRNPPTDDNPDPLMDARIEELIKKMDELQGRMKEAKEKEKKLLKKLTEGNKGRSLVDANIDELSLEELHKLSGSLEELYDKLCTQIQASSISTNNPEYDHTDPSAHINNPDINQTGGVFK
ncbi:putative mads box protein [Tripterygium wilfordii]|uniref:Putative mads box protein n=1 Tax=Tripterygium wilfordii TaxID=458696 RepID=A0A7J7CQC6_TRIWF|nr:agamous-like MADS-box protein AGL29 [Tripterygium wilfordii]KAF5736312.1 putative mads box protein [Tripterygium wilfordii]